MKRFYKFSGFLIPFLLIQISTGCQRLTEQLRIDLTTGFSGEFVEIRLDNKLIFNDSVSTSLVLGLADIITTDYPIGRTQLNVVVNGVISKDKFRHKEDQYIVVKLDRNSSKAIIEYPDNEFVYD